MERSRRMAGRKILVVLMLLGASCVFAGGPDWRGYGSAPAGVGWSTDVMRGVSVPMTSAVVVPEPELDTTALTALFAWPKYSFGAGGNTTWTNDADVGSDAIQLTDAFAPAASDSCVAFNTGAGTFVTHQPAAQLASSKSLTYVVRMRALSYGNLQVICSSSNGGNSRLMASRDAAVHYFSMIVASGLNDSAANAMEQDAYHVYAITVENTGPGQSTVKFFKDGVQSGSTSTPAEEFPTNDTTVQSIGCYQANGSLSISMGLKYFLVYSVAKTPAQVAAISSYLEDQP